MSDTQTPIDELMAARLAKLETQKQIQKTAYPNDFVRADYCEDLQEAFASYDKMALENQSRSVRVAGRLMLNRGAFLVIQDMTGRIQLYVDRKHLSADTLSLIKSLDLGDILGACGTLSRSGKGDLYVHLEEVRLLTKSLRPLPDKFHGLCDTEAKYRKRYLDLMTSSKTRDAFLTRSALIQGIRNFMLARRFHEVETPMMHIIPGGASARPFLTHHNALDMPLFLRIAPELYLKRLVIGGFERVFEINRNFRNEGISTRHNPEFTMMEFYAAYTTYEDLMALTEEMLEQLALDILGTTDVPYQGEVFNFKGPFAKMTMADAVLAHNDVLRHTDLEDKTALTRFIKETLDIEPNTSLGVGGLLTLIFEETVESQLRQPTFITEYPAETSPLARRNDDNPEVTDRFEMFIGGRELANGFSELNDPQDQASRFADQVAQKDAGDDEAMHFDADYIEALEYGLPPTAGQGIGIDRLAMIFADVPSIRDVILFPHMRHKIAQGTDKDTM